MTDRRLLEEILRSPLDDIPARTVEPRWLWIGGILIALVAGVLAFWPSGGGDDAAAPSVTAAAPAGSDAPAATGVPDDTSPNTTVADAVHPDGNGAWHEMVAIGDGEMLVFGGVTFPDGQNPTAFEGTWRFDVMNAAWSVENPGIAPSPRFGHAMAYHPPTGRVVVFGGGGTTPRPCPRIRICPGPEDNEVWQYDPDTGVWEDMTPADTSTVEWPIPRFGMRFVYEPVTGRLITFGGVGVFGEQLTPNFWNDTWAYDPATNTWEDLSDPDESNRPHGAVMYGLVWNEEAQRVLMFAGDGIPDDPQNLYAFDPATSTWEDLGVAEPGLGPKDRWFHSMVADPQSGRTVVFGGNGSTYQVIGGGTIRDNGDLDEVWTWSPAEGWVAAGAMDRSIVAAAAAGDPGGLTIIVYPGDDVLSYDAALDTWTTIWDRPGDD